MSKELKKILKEAYYKYKNHPNPPVPLKTIKRLLELEGLLLEN